MRALFAALLCLFAYSTLAQAPNIGTIGVPNGMPLGSLVPSFGGLQFSLAPGGLGNPSGTMTNYAAGDAITLSCTGVTFTVSPIVGVVAVSMGAVTGSTIVNPGITSNAVPNGSVNCSQASTTGSGTGYAATAILGVISSNISVPALSVGGGANNGNLFITNSSPGYNSPGINIGATVSSATVNSGGTGYGTSATGTLTYNGSGCTTNPVLNVSSNGSGVISTINSVTISGICSTFPSSPNTSWTAGGGLSAGSGVSINLVSPGWGASESTFVGLLAGAGFVGTATQNTALGEDACGAYGVEFWTAPTGSFNTCISGDAGRNIGGSASSNILVGAGAGRNLTSSNNVFIGVSSGGSNTNGGGPVSGASNIGIGTQSLGALTTGQQNVAVGSSGQAITTGSYNVLVGQSAGNGLTIQQESTIIGTGADSGGTGSYNTVVGFQAGSGLTGGQLNTLIGTVAATKVTSGGSNTIIGYDVATVTLTTGSSNVLIGNSASCDTPASGTSDYLGLCAGGGPLISVSGGGTPSTSTANIFSNTINLPNITNAAGNEILCYDTTGGPVTYESAVSGCVPSAKRLKNPKGKIDPKRALDRIAKLTAATYTYKDTVKFGAKEFDGLYADEVCAIDERLCDRDANGQVHNYDKTGMLAYLVAALGEQKREIDALKRGRRLHHRG
jgi:hypothetical protein